MVGMQPSRDRVLVVGLGADGWSGLSETVQRRVLAARIVIGSERQLALVPDVDGQQKCRWPQPFTVDRIPVADGVVVLASGDPLVSGVGSTLVERLGAERVEVIPQVSSVALARARMGWPAQRCAVVRVAGSGVAPVLRELAPGARVLVLSSDATTPAALSSLLVEAGFGATRVTVLGDLGSGTESRWSATAAQVAGSDRVHPRLNVVALEVAGPARVGWAAGLPDDAYEHDGQLTRRDLRAGALARLLPLPGQLVWDVGAGAGSVGIEWMRSHPSCSAIAVERNPVRAERITRNASRLGVPALQVVVGSAPGALEDLPDPDAVFVGGGASVGLLDLCRRRLRPSGRLVVHAVTLQTEQLLVEALDADGGELTRHTVETASPLGSFTSWTPSRAVVQWAWTKPSGGGTP